MMSQPDRPNRRARYLLLFQVLCYRLPLHTHIATLYAYILPIGEETIVYFSIYHSASRDPFMHRTDTVQVMYVVDQ